MLYSMIGAGSGYIDDVTDAVIEAVRQTIARYRILPVGCRVAVAVSGGADSVCLLHALGELGASISGVAHFNHKLRGAASDQDERFVSAMAARLRVPFFRAEVQGEWAGGNLEQAARVARRSFFQGLIRDGVCDRVALGHTRDDQAETVLFRVLRGSGLTGLAGIHPVTEDGLIRPLIGVRRGEVEQFLISRGIGWREDAMNREPRFARNRIRRDLLPQLAREWNPQIVDALANLADLAYEEERAAQVPCATEWKIEELKRMPRAIARRVIRRAIEAARGDLRRIEFRHVENMIEMTEGGPARVTAPGVEAVRSFDWIRIAAPGTAKLADPLEVTVPGNYPAPDGSTEIRIENPCANLKVELTAPIQLRGWRHGDHYRPVGRFRDQKIKELFQSARVPCWRRAAWPILSSGNKILWAREFGVAEEFAGVRVSEIPRQICG